MKRKIAFWCVMFVAMAIPVLATEFYRYVDQHGNVLYTDDLSNVPPEQREQVTSYDQSETAAPVPEAVVEPNKPADGANSLMKAQQVERNRLEALGKELDQEYERLTEERSKLDEEKNQAVTNAQIKAYNQKIIEFNNRIKAYDGKRNAYAEEIKAFNAQLDN